MPISRGVIVAITTSLLMGCGSMQRAYWDAKVGELCRKDGGVTVYERVKISSDDYKRLGGSGGRIPVPPKRIARPDAPYVTESEDAWLNEDPGVLQSETRIVRTSDKKVLSRMINYARVGQLFPGYGCADAGVSLDVVPQTFDVMGE